MKHSKRFLALLLAVLLVGSVLAGCASKEDVAGTVEPAQSQGADDKTGTVTPAEDDEPAAPAEPEQDEAPEASEAEETVESMEKVQVEFLGETHFAMKTHLVMEGIDIYNLQICFYQSGSYGVTVTLGSYIEDTTDSLLGLFYSL